jgi:hypothetical protein
MTMFAVKHTLTATLFIIGLGLGACSTQPAELGRSGLASAMSEPKPEIRADSIETASEPVAESRSELAHTLPDLGLAPDFNNQVWINTDTPLSLERLRGKVVLVEFWTYG